MTATTQKRSRGCLKGCATGCAAVAVLGALAVVAVALNFDRIRESDWYRSITDAADSARAEMVHMLELRAAVLAEFPADEVSVKTGFRSGDDGRTRSLTVELSNPAFELPDATEEQQAVAREIACRVVSLFPEVERFDRVDIVIARRIGSGVTISSDSRFPFVVADLIEGCEGAGAAPDAVTSEETPAEGPDA